MCVSDCPPPGFPLLKKTRKENTGVESFGSYIAGFLKRVGTLWAPALGLGSGAGAGRGVGEPAGWTGYFVDCSCCLAIPPPPLESFFLFFCASQKRKGTTSGGRSRARSLAPHRPSPVTSAGGLPGSLPRSRSGPPCAWTPSGEATRSGSSLRLAEHPGFSHNSRPLGRAAPHRSAHAPAACVLASQTLDFFFSCPPSFLCGGKSGFSF